MGLYKSQFISMIIMIALGVGIFVGFNMEWKSIDMNLTSFFEKTGYADYRIVSENGFTKEKFEKIVNINGVDAASRYLSVNVDVKEYSGDSVSLTVSENESVSGIYLIKGESYDPKSPDGIWLSDKYAAANGINVGDSLTLVYKNIEIDGIVKGMIKSGEYTICVRDESQLMPDYNTYGFAYISPYMYEKNVGFDFYPQINVLSNMPEHDFHEAVDLQLENTVLILTKDETISYTGAYSEVQEGQTMGLILPVLFLLIAVLTMVTTMHRLVVKEKTQIGTLKALGFKDRRILRHYTSYALMVGVVGSVIGVCLGYGIARFIMNPNGMMGTYLDLPQWKLHLPWFCYIILAAIIILLTSIGFLSVKKMLKGSAADALRSYTPKKFKPLAIEKTRIFEKLSFGTRWNLRDITRHKSRTAMSLLGTVGCIMIIVCALGMRDTTNAFLDLYYDGAINYSSRIYLSEDATSVQRDELAAKYCGDWSSSVSVKLNEKTASLDIYNINYDKIRFPDKNNNYIAISNSGAYICLRIANEFGLEVGDTFTVSPYGLDTDYKLRVAGIIRSVSENIVISPIYAEELGINYTIDSIYTDTLKAEIQSSSAIKNVQSKQTIMDSFDSFMEIMDIMIYVLILGAMLLGIIVLYNLGVMSYTERYREMATLKVVGFKDKKIGKLLISQNLWVSFLGVIIGLPLGVFVLNYLLKALASEYEMKMILGLATYIVSIILTFGISVFVGLIIAGKNKKIDMVSALKGVE